MDFTGQTDAVQSVDIRARVNGYLKSTHFKEGAEVKEDDLLFEIDPRPYQAQLAQAVSQVALNEASLRLARTTLARDQSLSSQARGAVPLQQLDQDFAAVEEAEARLKAYQASTEVYKLNLGYTKVRSPLSGQISRYYLTRGNLVIQDQTLLTTVVSLDPMYAYFSMDEPTLKRVKQAINEGKLQRLASGQVPVWMGLQGDDGFPHQGVINFINNQVNPTTGSISVRCIFANPKPGDLRNAVSALALCCGGQMTWPASWIAGTLPAWPDARLLSPGMFVRIRFPMSQPHPALLVIDRAIQSDQGLKYVYVIDSEGKAEYRRVTTGPLQEDGLRVVNPYRLLNDGKSAEGLKSDDWIIVGGLQQVRPRMAVEVERIAMPSLAARPFEVEREQEGKGEKEKGGKAKGKKGDK